MLASTTLTSPGSSLDSILKKVMAGAGQSLEEAETLPREAYTSQDFFDLEMEQLMKEVA